MTRIADKEWLLEKLGHYKLEIENAIPVIFQSLPSDHLLKEASLYSLLSEGKRFRPICFLLIKEALQSKFSLIKAAISVEIFHTASLIIDDLPFMDNDDFRRGKPALHKVYGVDAATLSSFALMGMGYELIVQCGNEIGDSHRALLAIESVSKGSGFLGAPWGQYLDLHPPKDLKEKLEIIHSYKTGCFFESTFLLGWILGGGDLSKIGAVKKAAYHFGLAFQIHDDFLDASDDLDSGSLNFYNLLGPLRTKEKVLGHLSECKIALHSLGLDSEVFLSLLSWMENNILSI